jgi:cytochrome c oxidase subunit 4
MAKDHAHEPSFKTDIFTWVALMILTGVTVWVADLTGGASAMAVAIALSVATVKAAVVLFYFMHLKWDNIIYKIFMALIVVLFLTFIAFMVADYALR